MYVNHTFMSSEDYNVFQAQLTAQVNAQRLIEAQYD